MVVLADIELLQVYLLLLVLYILLQSVVLEVVLPQVGNTEQTAATVQ